MCVFVTESRSWWFFGTGEWPSATIQQYGHCRHGPTTHQHGTPTSRTPNAWHGTAPQQHDTPSGRNGTASQQHGTPTWRNGTASGTPHGRRWTAPFQCGSPPWQHGCAAKNGGPTPRWYGCAPSKHGTSSDGRGWWSATHVCGSASHQHGWPRTELYSPASPRVPAKQHGTTQLSPPAFFRTGDAR